MKKLNIEYEIKKNNLQTKEEETKQGEEILDMINEILAFARYTPKFDTTFVLGVLEKYQTKECINEAQKRALKNIYVKWRVRETLEKMKEGDDE